MQWKVTHEGLVDLWIAGWGAFCEGPVFRLTVFWSLYSCVFMCVIPIDFFLDLWESRVSWTLISLHCFTHYCLVYHVNISFILTWHTWGHFCVRIEGVRERAVKDRQVIIFKDIYKSSVSIGVKKGTRNNVIFPFVTIREINLGCSTTTTAMYRGSELLIHD